MKLSILILTHNRPILFKRCIDSVLNTLPDYSIEILVNNDTKDIQEIHTEDTNVQYSYYQSYDLSKTYENLFNRARGEYIYFLEDDDYIKPDFFSALDFNYDVNYLEYISQPLIEELGPAQQLKRMTLNRCLSHVSNLMEFLDCYDDRDFQLGQIMFKRCLVSQFPEGNNINNDLELFRSLIRSKATIKYILGQRWIQTTSGGDNISFDNLNRDDRFC
jgi:glycosyltransferase involved in cell wall biosynthesis